MSILVGSTEKRVGLALSGGGFRAAAFHLGVFRKLREIGLLWKLDLLTCVSGGSIAGAFLACHWGEDDALDKLEAYLRSKSIAVSSVIGGVLDPFASRLDKLAESYQRDLYGDRTLGSLLNGRPRLYLNTTNLATGNMFFFVTGGGSDQKAEMGEWELGTTDAPDFPLCRAVAASSAFPPVFPPLKIEQSLYPAAGVEYVTLTDGGVYDNLGVNPLFRKRNKLDYLLVSDAGKPFSVDQHPTESSAAVLVAAIDILMEQVRGLQFKRLELSADGLRPLWFSIDSTLGEARDGDAAFASAVGTNLKRLSAAEMAVLVRHSGALLAHRLQTHAPELLGV